MLKELHDSPIGFGENGSQRHIKMLPLIKKYNIKTILDYGCGKGLFQKALEEAKKAGEVDIDSVTGYDPGVDKYSKKPTGKFDMVVCTDVLEHIEPLYLQNVLHEIGQYTGKIAYLLMVEMLI
jgi:2-polyprenyl-3-methyl-5-hydroxy-6-metoxy-1,4-benzoquinol methylase